VTSHEALIERANRARDSHGHSHILNVHSQRDNLEPAAIDDKEFIIAERFMFDPPTKDNYSSRFLMAERYDSGI
jgi:hypothetical protein